MTRCGVLSVVSSLFDPLGFIAPFIMKAKLLLQDLFRKKLGWDNVIDEQESVQWLACWKTYQKYKCFKLNDALSRRTLAKQRVFSCTFSQMDHAYGMKQWPTCASSMSSTESVVALPWGRLDWPPSIRSLFQGWNYLRQLSQLS